MSFENFNVPLASQTHVFQISIKTDISLQKPHTIVSMYHDKQSGCPLKSHCLQFFVISIFLKLGPLPRRAIFECRFKLYFCGHQCSWIFIVFTTESSQFLWKCVLLLIDLLFSPTDFALIASQTFVLGNYCLL